MPSSGIDSSVVPFDGGDSSAGGSLSVGESDVLFMFSSNMRGTLGLNATLTLLPRVLDRRLADEIDELPS